jgi:hypothetical protein
MPEYQLHDPQGVGTLHRDHSLVLQGLAILVIDEVEEGQQVGKSDAW